MEPSARPTAATMLFRRGIKSPREFQKPPRCRQISGRQCRLLDQQASCRSWRDQLLHFGRSGGAIFGFWIPEDSVVQATLMQVKKAAQPEPESLSHRFRRLHVELEQVACEILEQRVAADKAAHPGLPVQNLEMMINKAQDLLLRSGPRDNCHGVVAL